MFKYAIKKQNSIKYYYEKKVGKHSLISLISNYWQGLELGCTKFKKIKRQDKLEIKKSNFTVSKRFEKKEITFVNH
jgi:hypothetical protein